MNPILGDVVGNIKKTLKFYNQAVQQGADLVVCSEANITGYPLEDLVRKHDFLYMVRDEVLKISPLLTEGVGLIIGTPWTIIDDQKVYNAAVLLQKEDMPQFSFKYELPNYGVFDEKRVFTSADYTDIRPMHFKGYKLGTLICEDTWFEKVSKTLKDQGAQILISLNGSPFEYAKQNVRYEVVEKRCIETNLDCVYVNQVGGQDELIFDGSSFVVTIIQKMYTKYANPDVKLKRMMEDMRVVNFKDDNGVFRLDRNDVDQILDNTPYPIGPEHEVENYCETTYNALVLSLRDYYEKSGIFKGVCLGLSGGVDSALVAAIAADALGKEKVLTVRLPSKYSSDHSLSDAADLANRIGVRCKTIDIQQTVDALEFNESLQNIFKEEGKTEADTTEENIQARVRGNFLMSISNKLGYLLLSTGNKSEVSVGYATLYGDMNGGFNVLKNIYKTDVFSLCEWRNKNIPELSICLTLDVIPQNIITKPPSAELRPDQKDQDSLLPYPRLDAILRCLIDEGKSIAETVDITGETIDNVVRIRRMISLSEYKRFQSCPGPKVGHIDFGDDWRFPIINKFW